MNEEYSLEQYFHDLQPMNARLATELALDQMVRINQLLGLYELDGKPNPLIKSLPVEDNIILGYN